LRGWCGELAGGRPASPGFGRRWGRKPLHFHVVGLAFYGYFYRGVAQVAHLHGIPPVAYLNAQGG
jgi:hypothetical protein